MPSSVVKTLRKRVRSPLKRWITLYQLGWSRRLDLTMIVAYMMECPNLVFVGEQPVLLYCPQGLDKAVLNYDNIYPNMYKIRASFDPEQARRWRIWIAQLGLRLPKPVQLRLQHSWKSLNGWLVRSTDVAYLRPLWPPRAFFGQKS